MQRPGGSASVRLPSGRRGGEGRARGRGPGPAQKSNEIHMRNVNFSISHIEKVKRI